MLSGPTCFPALHTGDNKQIALRYLLRKAWRHRCDCASGRWCTVTFGWGGQPVASRCSCSEVWLQERRSEQQAVRPSLFIREEMMLQPQPHIDLLISSLAVLGLEAMWRGKLKKGRGATSCSHFLVKSPQFSLKLMLFLWCIPHGADPQVFRHWDQVGVIYSQGNTDADAHLNPNWRHLSWKVQFFGPFPSWLLPTYSTSISEQTHTSCWSSSLFCQTHSHPIKKKKNTFTWYWKSHTGCNVCPYSLLPPTISICFLPLPPLPSAAVQWGCYPRQRCCHHHCTHTHPTTTTTSSGKPLRLSSSNNKSASLIWHPSFCLFR